MPPEVPPRPWHTVTIDYVTGFPKTEASNDAIAVYVDKLTKYVHLVACSKESSAIDWVNMFVDHVHVHHGLPEKLISNRGTQFTSAFNQSLAQRLGYAWALSTARHPQTDGQTERANRIVEDVLRHFVSPTMTDWDKQLSLVLFAINNAWQETVQETPNFLNFGSHPKTPLTVGLPSKHLVLNPTAGEFADRMQQVIARAKKFTFAAQQRQKRFYDSKHTDAEYQVGQKLLLSTTELQLKVRSALQSYFPDGLAHLNAPSALAC